MSALRRSALFLGCFALAACSSPGTQAAGRSKSSPIVHGIPSDASQDAVVLLIHDDGAFEDSCTATLIAPNLVLTARHCVSTTGDAGFSCGADGVGSPEGNIGADFPPSSLTIYVGVNLPGDSDPPAATGKQIFHDGATNLCNHDLALILLDKAVPDAKLAALRLTDTTKPGELVTTVGWGVTDKTFDPETRMQRTGVAIQYVGKDVENDVAPNEFEVGESICEGDSGGPALSAAGAIVGIVSRGANDVTDPDMDAPGSDCVDPGASNDFTKVASFTSVILGAFDAAGATPIREGSTPTTDTGPVDDVGTTTDSDLGGLDAPSSIDDADAGATPPVGSDSSSGGCAIAAVGASSPSSRSPSSPSSPFGQSLAALAMSALCAGVVIRRRR